MEVMHIFLLAGQDFLAKGDLARLSSTCDVAFVQTRNALEHEFAFQRAVYQQTNALPRKDAFVTFSSCVINHHSMVNMFKSPQFNNFWEIQRIANKMLSIMSMDDGMIAFHHGAEIIGNTRDCIYHKKEKRLTLNGVAMSPFVFRSLPTKYSKFDTYPDANALGFTQKRAKEISQESDLPGAKPLEELIADEMTHLGVTVV